MSQKELLNCLGIGMTFFLWSAPACKAQQPRLVADSISNIQFSVNALKEPPGIVLDSVEVSSMMCEIQLNFGRELVAFLCGEADSVRPVQDVVGNCWDGHHNYDSFLRLYYTDKTNVAIRFLCKDYDRGIVFGEGDDPKWTVYFSSAAEERLGRIAQKCRDAMGGLTARGE